MFCDVPAEKVSMIVSSRTYLAVGWIVRDVCGYIVKSGIVWLRHARAL
jgi:hypothetical protein